MAQRSSQVPFMTFYIPSLKRELNPETLVTFCYLFISFVSGYALYVDGTSADLPEVDAA